MILHIERLKGFSLIEVLISLVLISLILLGLDAIQINALREAKIACMITTARYQIENAEERLSALGLHDGLLEQLAIWNAENQSVLPQGFGTITGYFPYYVITVYWGNSPHVCATVQSGRSGCLRKTIHLA